VLPKYGKNRAAIDLVIEGALCIIIDAYRLPKTRAKPFWKGPAYQINRREMAWMLDCRLRHISTALGHLEKLGLISVHRKARYVGGEPKGTMVYAIPDVEAIAGYLVQAEQKIKSLRKAPDDQDAVDEGDDTKVPDSDIQGGEVEHSMPLNSGSQALKDEHKSLNVLERQYYTDDDDKNATSRDGAIDAARASAQLSPEARDGQRAEVPKSGAPSPKPLLPEQQAERFIFYWIEAGRRSKHLILIQVGQSEREELINFFQQNQVKACWFAAVAIRAWQAAENVEKPKKKDDFDTAWGCRHSSYIQGFLRHRAKILSELGANGFKVNAYTNLRWYFTDSELRENGFKVDVGLDVIDPEDAWENDEDAPNYYQRHKMQMPPEVRAAAAERADNDDEDDHTSDSGQDKNC
jgi:hypothetical protein